MKTTVNVSFVKKIGKMMKSIDKRCDVIGKYPNQIMFVDRFFFF